MTNHISTLFPLFKRPLLLALWAIAALLAPNLALNCTEGYSLITQLVNLTLPAGFFLLCFASWRRVGIMTLLMLPFMIFSAFQIVLLYLYGESIIAVDMFLNVVTTNVDEASRLLENLVLAIVVVVLLYVPLLITGIVAICKRWFLERQTRREFAVWGSSLLLFSIAMIGVTEKQQPLRKWLQCIFPVNVIENLCEAVHRTSITNNYAESSAGFTYQATNERSDDSPQVHVMVIGETSRALNWQLNGYQRATNPRLSADSAIVYFPYALSQSNTTHKSVPMLISAVSPETFTDIHKYKSILTAMKEAGYTTHFFSNQARNRSFTEFFGEEADDIRYTAASETPHPYDTSLIEMVEEVLADTVGARHFILLHSYGSHFLYSDRYPEEFRCYMPDEMADASFSNRDKLINAYDNTILFTDHFLAEIINRLNRKGCLATLTYSSDHGEDIFDDSRKRFLHASPKPTYYQLHVPMLVWTSAKFGDAYPEILVNLRKNAANAVAPQTSMFHTVMQLAGVGSPYADHTLSLADSLYHYRAPLYVNDLNEAVGLFESGLKENDKKLINALFKKSVTGAGSIK